MTQNIPKMETHTVCFMSPPLTLWHPEQSLSISPYSSKGLLKL